MTEIWTKEQEAERLEARFAQLKAEMQLTQADFARTFAMPGGASMVNQHIKGRRPLSLEHAIIYARGFGCELAEISPRLALMVERANSEATQENSDSTVREFPRHNPDTISDKEPYTGVSHRGAIGSAQRPLATADLLSDEPEYIGPIQPRGRVVVKGMAKMGPDGFYDEVSEIMGSVDSYSADPDAYALRVRGDSNYPAIRDGWYVVVEPRSEPTVGEYVLVKLRDGRKMVKEFLFARQDSITIMSVNGQVRQTIPLEDVEGIHPIASIVPPSKWHPD